MHFRLASLEDIQLLIDLRKQLLVEEGQIVSSHIEEELKNFLKTRYHQVNMHNG